MPSPYTIITAAHDYDLVRRTSKRIGAEWPEFMLHDPVADYLSDCYDRLPACQFVVTAPDAAEPVAIANSIPLAYAGAVDDLPDNGWDWALTKGMEDHAAGRTPTILCALQIVVFSEHRGKGISRRGVEGMRKIAAELGLNGLIAPVRPTMKSLYPLIPIDDYIRWTNSDGRLFDPWLCVHVNLGARVVKACPNAMRITGTVAEWESWTGLRFPQTGSYIVPGALIPIEIDCEADRGVYIEPNVWMHHAM